MYLSNGHLQPMYLEVPCGRCAECMELKRDQWYLRNYWHSKECFDNGGYCFFETLTYRDEALPHLSWWFPEFEGKSYDYPCFCYEHYRNFMKRLRINLSRGVYEPDYLEVQNLRKEKKQLKEMKSKYPLRKKVDKINNGLKRQWIDNRIREIDYQIEDLVPYLKKWNVAEKFDAFCVTEYGDDAVYRDDRGKLRKGTFRPHYHLLFYVNIPDLPSTKLAEYIYKSWKHGKTDSYDIDGNMRTSYVRTHNTIGKNYKRDSELELRRVSKYVAKYITKDAKYSDRIKQRVQYAGERIGRVYEEYDGEFYTIGKENSYINVNKVILSPKYEYTYDNTLKKYCKKQLGFEEVEMKCMRLVRVQKDLDKLKKLVDGFHLQGLGFGMYALDPMNFDEDELLEKGTFKMSDSIKLSKHIPAPQYYIRKLYYNLVTPNDDWRVNSPTYVINEKGKEFKKSSLKRMYNNQVKKYTDLYLNMTDRDRFNIDFMLDGRGIDDYVLYKCFYQNRIVPEHFNPDLDDAINKIVDTDNRVGDIYIDKEHYVWIRNGLKYDVTEYDDYCRFNMINQWSHPYFIHFDFIDELFAPYIEKKNEERQKLFDHIEIMRKRLGKDKK